MNVSTTALCSLVCLRSWLTMSWWSELRHDAQVEASEVSPTLCGWLGISLNIVRCWLETMHWTRGVTIGCAGGTPSLSFRPARAGDNNYSGDSILNRCLANCRAASQLISIMRMNSTSLLPALWSASVCSHRRAILQSADRLFDMLRGERYISKKDTFVITW